MCEADFNIISTYVVLGFVVFAVLRWYANNGPYKLYTGHEAKDMTTTLLLIAVSCAWPMVLVIVALNYVYWRKNG